MGCRAFIVGLLAVALGLFVGPVAEAGCAGPQLRISGVPFTPVPDGAPLHDEPYYTVQPGQAVTVQAKNLGPCGPDVFTGGCGAEPRAEPMPSPTPVLNVPLILEQGPRRWRLGVADAPAPDYDAITYPVNLPPDLRLGWATLRLRGGTLAGETYVRLRVA